jgi:hypothetical protein
MNMSKDLTSTDLRGFPAADGPVQREWTVPCPTCHAGATDECCSVNTGCILNSGHLRRHLLQNAADKARTP